MFLPLARRSALLCLLALPLLAGCGGGAENPLERLYTSLAISELSYPADEEKNDEILIEARASSTGEISGGDIDWELDQSSGHAVSNIRKELADDNHKVVFRATAPDHTGKLNFTLKAKARGYSDSRDFAIEIR